MALLPAVAQCRRHRRASRLAAALERHSPVLRSASCLTAVFLLAAAGYLRAQPGPSHPLAAMLLAAAPLIGLTGYLIGVVLTIAGNLLRGTADTPVADSPFLPVPTAAVVFHRHSAGEAVAPAHPHSARVFPPLVLDIPAAPPALAVRDPWLLPAPAAPAAPAPASQPSPAAVLTEALGGLGLATLLLLLLPQLPGEADRSDAAA